MGDMAHINTIFKFLPHTHQRVWQELEYCMDVCRVARGADIEHLWLSKKTFGFPVAVNSSIKVGPLVFLL